jgi:glutathione S-transferase
MAPVVLGYWGLRGLGAPIQYLLEHVGEKYEFKNWSEDHKPDWFGQKNSLGLAFPNLPYLIDGDVKLTQSAAILKYLGRKHGLVATSENDIQIQEQLEGVLGDLRMGWGLLCYGAQDFEKEKDAFFVDRLTPNLKLLEQHIAGKQYLVGNKVNFIDFSYFEFLDVASKLYGVELLAQFPNLKKFHNTIANLKGVKEFLASGRNFEKINGPMAKWGG